MNANYTNIWSEDILKIIANNPSIMDEWVLVVAECHQYAEGICGQNFYASIIFKDMDYETSVGHGFPKKGDPWRLLDSSWLRALTKKKISGRRTPYGEVGAHYRIAKTLKFKDLVHKNPSSGEWFFKRDIHPFGHYWNYSMPAAVDGRKHPAAQSAPSAASLF